MKYLSLCLILGLIVLFLSTSFEKPKEVGDAREGDSSGVMSKRRHSSVRQKVSAMIGKTLLAGDVEEYDQWVEDFSRSEGQQDHRRQQLAHMLRAEVLEWGISDQDLESLKSNDEPVSMELPFFENQTLEVIVEEVRRFGSTSINVKGYLASGSESKVHISLTHKSPTITIEGPNALYYYETYEGVVLLREDVPGSQHADFSCNCERHQMVGVQ